MHQSGLIGLQPLMKGTQDKSRKVNGCRMTENRAIKDVLGCNGVHRLHGGIYEQCPVQDEPQSGTEPDESMGCLAVQKLCAEP